MKKAFLIFTFAMAFVAGAFAQSKTVTDFGEKADGYRLYLYQSLIRMMNKDKSADFNKLIEDLDHLKLFTTDSTGAAAKVVWNNLDKGVRSEGFEEIMTFDNVNYNCHIYELEGDDEKSSWVATMYLDGTAGVIEMKGSLNVKYLTAFESLNMEMLQGMLPLEAVDKLNEK